MKKMSLKQRRRFEKRARDGSRKKTCIRTAAIHRRRSLQKVDASHTVELWDGNRVEHAICRSKPDQPPKEICLDTNLDATLEFLTQLATRVGASVKSGRRGGWIQRSKGQSPRIRKYIDFSSIEALETAPALILAATYDRGKILTSFSPPAVNFSKWSPHAFKTLYEIGFFEIIGHGPAERISEVYSEHPDGSYKVSKILSGTNADGLEEVSDVVLELLDYLELNPDVAYELITEINSAVSEAMINVARHAYPEKNNLSVESTSKLHKWWMSARADKSSNKLTLVVYDHGATIPGTLPKREWYKDAVKTVMETLGRSYDENHSLMDHEFINYSMKKGKTQTGESSRGLGLPQMQELIDVCPDGTLSILSRNGLYKYGKKLGVYIKRNETTLDGTLIQWELTLPRGLE